MIFGLSNCAIFFPLYLTHDTIFGGKLFNVKYEFWISLQDLSGIFLILRTAERVTAVNVRASVRKVSVILVGF
jgi:hypothetical protein